ncbi:MAG TPA: phosphoribosylaminoimidazolesuccinocarboxamide synthase [Candidatus Sulfotelmatobacter sp.]|nr:phosphoribosylaminoimidazolesuccinocarboxamide synthase [Candidatus Sulfotelmatobacter sp.]
MEKLRKLYEGKAKILYETADPELLIQHFKDDATAFNAAKRGTIVQKGILNNQISTRVFEYLEGHGIPTHYVRTLSDRDMLVRRLEIVLIEVVVRNTVAGSLAKRLGLEEGTPLQSPVLEFYYKSDALGDPMINDDHIRLLGLAAPAEVQAIREQAMKINATLLPFFAQRDILLVDFKVEFGRHHGRLLLGDEITPDGCRLWDRTTREKMDKDRFRRDLGRVEEAYQEVHRRVCGP